MSPLGPRPNGGDATADMRRSASQSNTAFALAIACVGLFALPAVFVVRGNAIAGHRARETIADIAAITAQDVRQRASPTLMRSRVFIP